MPFFLCVDCGGSKTSAVICDHNGNIRGRARGGPSNYAFLDIDTFTATVRETVLNALGTCIPHSSLPPPPNTFAAAWFGVSGAGSPAAIASLIPILSNLVGIQPGPRLLIENDVFLLAAPMNLYTDVSHCVACIAGTGTNAMIFVKSDRRIQQIARVGGWGWILGDEGGGFHVGREAIRQLLTEADKASLGAAPAAPLANGKPTLEARVLDHFGIGQIHELFGVLYHPDPIADATPSSSMPVSLPMTRQKRLSSLCTLVFSSAFEDGDPLALNVLRVCADSVASQLSLLLTHDASPDLPRAVKAEESVICFGGSLVAVEAYRNLVLDNLAQRGHVFKHVRVIEDAAAIGAASLAISFRDDLEGDWL